MKKILSCLRRAIEDYNMIEENDKIAVGVSGGKDSITLLYALSELKKFYPKKFDLVGITLDLGFDGFNPKNVIDFCKDKNIEYVIEKTNIKEIVFDYRKESNPCSLCANLRRGALNNVAKSLNYNKVALGHHNDDVIETFYLNLLYEGRLGCFSPVTYLNRMDITKIRPFIYIKENEIIGVVKRLNLPVIFNPCPANGQTKRQEIKELISKLDREIVNSKQRVFNALKKSGIDGWK